MITTESAFIYGFNLTSENNLLNFDEGNGELTVELAIGNYSAQELADEIASKMSLISVVQEYSVELENNTLPLRFSITGVLNNNFDLLISSGSGAAISAYSLIGFTGADLTGLSTYTGNNQAGSVYYPQFLLQNYVDFEDDQSTSASVVNKSTDGTNIEVVSYGNVKIMSCDFLFITDIINQKEIKNNPNGVSDAREFMKYAITKGKIDFIKDIETPNVALTCILESTPQSQQGTAFKLNELYARRLAGYFELTGLKFRLIEG